MRTKSPNCPWISPTIFTGGDNRSNVGWSRNIDLDLFKIYLISSLETGNLSRYRLGFNLDLLLPICTNFSMIPSISTGKLDFDGTGGDYEDSEDKER